MHTIGKKSVFVLLALALTTGCSHKSKECEISCADGFRTTQDGSCDSSMLTSLAAVHGGSCRGEEHIARATTEPHDRTRLLAAIDWIAVRSTECKLASR